jgi:hypothetical protein
MPTITNETINGQPYKIITYPNGRVDTIWNPAPAPAPNYLYIIGTVSGGDGMSPVGILNDGSTSATIALIVSSSPSAPTAVALSGTWRIPIRDSSGNIRDIILMTITNGVASLTYSMGSTAAPAMPGNLSILESDFGPVVVSGVTYTLKLVNPLNLIVYRSI